MLKLALAWPEVLHAIKYLVIYEAVGWGIPIAVLAIPALWMFYRTWKAIDSAFISGQPFSLLFASAARQKRGLDL